MVSLFGNLSPASDSLDLLFCLVLWSGHEGEGTSTEAVQRKEKAEHAGV